MLSKTALYRVAMQTYRIYVALVPASLSCTSRGSIRTVMFATCAAF
jgi:hypothetical protein